MSQIEIDAILQSAMRHRQAGQPAQAEALYRQILAQHPDHDGALHCLGILAAQAGRHDLAIECLRRAAEIQPANSTYQNNLGTALIAQDRRDEAAACYRRALELNAHLVDAKNNLGAILKEQG